MLRLDLNQCMFVSVLMHIKIFSILTPSADVVLFTYLSSVMPSKAFLIQIRGENQINYDNLGEQIRFSVLFMKLWAIISLLFEWHSCHFISWLSRPL